MSTPKKPSNWIPLPNVPLREPRKLRVVTVGAGFSGLIMAHKIQNELKLEDIIDHQVYEKNPEVGGTWFENHYPGAACDVPAHMYVFLWEPNPDFTAFYAGAPEILAYIKRTADKYNLKKNISFNSKLVEAIWHDDIGRWKLKIEKDGEVIVDECDIFVDATGILNKWDWPKIEGLHDFKGQLLHSAQWDNSFDCKDKRIGVIGNGSSALQIVPNMWKKIGTGHVWNFIRSPTWVSPGFLAEFTKDGTNFKYTEEEKKRFRENPEDHKKYRKALEHNFNKFFYSIIKESPEQKAAFEGYTQQMQKRLQKDPELAKKLIPTYEVGCRRLSPGDGYLEALVSDEVTAEWSPIVKVTEKGVQTKAGLVELDALVCATGFDVSWCPRWKVRGQDGMDLAEEWKDIPRAYMAVAAAKMPNYFVFNGPNACAGHGSLHAVMDSTADYICKWAKKIATEDIKSVTVKPEVVDDWNVWAQELLKGTAWAGACKTWYRKNRDVDDPLVTAMYPGSMIHYKEMIDGPRPEDFEIAYRSPNRFRFCGNGFTQREKRGGDLAFYVQ